MIMSAPDKLLVAMLVLNPNTVRASTYEDIVVKAYELYPSEFQMRGYAKYPDSSKINRPLSWLKRAEYVCETKKVFALTESGLAFATILSKSPATFSNGENLERLPRDLSEELDRIRKTSAWYFYMSGEREKILGADFYAYLGVTEECERSHFIGRLTSVHQAAKTAEKLRLDPDANTFLALHNHMTVKFTDLIRRKMKTKL